MTSPFSPVPELRIGTVVEVSGTSIEVELDRSITELTKTYAGFVYPIGQIGSTLKIHYGRVVLIAHVTLLRMASDEDHLEPGTNSQPDSRRVEADLFGEVTWQESKLNAHFRRGVRTYPLPGQGVYLVTRDELRRMYEGAQSSQPDPIDALVPIGSYFGVDGTQCLANIDKLFGQHCAVLGSTGCGKSATVASLIRSVLEHQPEGCTEALKPLIVIIDPHGEYSTAFSDCSTVFRAYSVGGEPSADATKELSLPYWVLGAEEIRELVVGKTEHEATSEANIVIKALTHARQVQRKWIEPSKSWANVSAKDMAHPEEPRILADISPSKIASYDPDTPDPFTWSEFIQHFGEQQMRVKSEKWDPSPPSECKSYTSIMNKLSVLRTDPRLAFMMREYREGDPDLNSILAQFAGRPSDSESAHIRIVDISGLPNEVAGPLTATIARLLFQYKTWQTREERESNPVLLVCEEAHRYVPNRGEAEYSAAQRAIRRIAKEGRKYGIGLLLVSQRPADVEPTVLSQCSSWIVMRLTNSADQECVARFLPDTLGGLVRVLPSLSRQEALFVGEACVIPARFTVRTLEKRYLPRSQDISFAKGWSQPAPGSDCILETVRRWRRDA